MMEHELLGTCPRCGQAMERGFASRSLGLSWITPAQLRQFAFVDTDLHRRGLRQFLPGKAEYDLSYHCPACQLYLVDYSRALSRAEAEALAATM